MRLVVFALVIALVAGCVSNPGDYKGVAEKISVKWDTHKALALLEGPQVFFDENLSTYFIRGWPSRPVEPRFQVYVHARLSRWAMLEQAYSHGRKLDTTQIDRYKGKCESSCTKYSCSRTCTYHEDIGVNLTSEEMSGFIDAGGLAFKLEGKRRSTTIQIPAAYLKAMLDSWNAVHDQVKKMQASGELPTPPPPEE